MAAAIGMLLATYAAGGCAGPLQQANRGPPAPKVDDWNSPPTATYTPPPSNAATSSYDSVGDMYYGSRDGACRGDVLRVVDGDSLLVFVDAIDLENRKAILVTNVLGGTGRFADGDRYHGILRLTGRVSDGSATVRTYEQVR